MTSSVLFSLTKLCPDLDVEDIIRIDALRLPRVASEAQAIDLFFSENPLDEGPGRLARLRYQTVDRVDLVSDEPVGTLRYFVILADADHPYGRDQRIIDVWPDYLRLVAERDAALETDF